MNWCPALGTVLANEEARRAVHPLRACRCVRLTPAPRSAAQVIDGLSERGNHPVIRRPMRQWMLRITAYADRLIEDLEGLDW